MHVLSNRAQTLSLRNLVGSGDKIAIFTLPFLIVGLGLSIAFPTLFALDGKSAALRALAFVALVAGLMVWAWSVVLLLKHVPHRELITSGPFAAMRHPLYTSVALLVIPAIGILFDSWLGVVIGIVMYVASRRHAPAEETELSKAFGASWHQYATGVWFRWL